MEKSAASVTIHVEVLDPQETWRYAYRTYEEQNGTADQGDFEDICGTEAKPCITSCLRVIFHPGESPPGIHIYDSNAELESTFSSAPDKAMSAPYPSLADALARDRSAIFAVLRENDVSDECFAAIAAITHQRITDVRAGGASFANDPVADNLKPEESDPESNAASPADREAAWPLAIGLDPHTQADKPAFLAGTYDKTRLVRTFTDFRLSLRQEDNPEGNRNVIVPRDPTAEMLREAVYNTNRKYKHDPVDPSIAENIWSTMISARPISASSSQASDR